MNPPVAAVPAPTPAQQQAAAYAAAINNDEVGMMLEKLISETEALMASLAQIVPSMHNPLHGLLESLVLTRRSRDAGVALQLLKKAVDGLLDSPNFGQDQETAIRYRDLHLRILKCLQDQRAYGMQWTNKNVTHCIIECRDEFRFNFEPIDYLIRYNINSFGVFSIDLV